MMRQNEARLSVLLSVACAPTLGRDNLAGDPGLLKFFPLIVTNARVPLGV